MNIPADEEIEATGGATVMSRTARGEVWRRFRRNKFAVAALVGVVLMITVAILAPLVAPFDPKELDVGPVREGPSGAHWFGTDNLGRDVLSRVVFGACPALVVGLGSMLIAVTLGILFGAIAGWYGGWSDTLVMRSTDVLLSLPYFILGVVFLTAVGPSVPAMVILLGITGWLVIARVVRASFLQAHELEYIEAARALGFSNRRIMFRHVLPNAIQPVIVYASIGVGTAVLAVASFSFLKVGLDDDWGVMVNEGKGFLSTSPHLVFFPGAAIFVLVLVFVLIGDGLRNALDPRERP